MKRDKNLKGNSRPVSTLPNVLMIFDWFLFKKMSNFVEPFFSKQQCGFADLVTFAGEIFNGKRHFSCSDDKCHLLVGGKNDATMNVSGFKIKQNECKKLLGIKTDYGMKFENYLNSVTKKACNKINALSRVTPFMNLSN